MTKKQKRRNTFSTKKVAIMKKKLIALMGVLFVTTLSCAGTYTYKWEMPVIGGKTIHINFKDGLLSVDEHKNKVVLMEVWGVNCPPCLMSIPHYKKLISKYKEDLEMIALEVPLAQFSQISKDDLSSFVNTRGINYDVIHHNDSGEFLAFFSRFTGWDGNLPFLVIFDKSGKAIAKGMGMPDESSLEKFLKKLIDEKKSDGPKNKSDNADKNSSTQNPQ